MPSASAVAARSAAVERSAFVADFAFVDHSALVHRSAARRAESVLPAMELTWNGSPR